MPGSKARQAEMELRLMNLIDILQDEAPDCPAPPESAAALWTEAEVRNFFRSNGTELPAKKSGGAKGEPLPEVTPGQPGGGSLAFVGTDDWAKPPDQVKHGQAFNATIDNYQRLAIQIGIPDRPHGHFPPGDPVLAHIAGVAGMKPFQKLLVGASGELELVHGSWAVGDNAAKNGIDLRYFFDTSTAKAEKGNRLMAAVRFSDDAAIAKGFWTSAHGGAVETVLDEATAEIAKIAKAATATTISATFQIKKPCPLNTSLLIEASIVSVVSNGLRINTEASLKGLDGSVYATAVAQLVDMGRIARGG